MQKLRGFVMPQPGIGQQDFETCPKLGAGFTGFSGADFALTILYTMYIMLSKALK